MLQFHSDPEKIVLGAFHDGALICAGFEPFGREPDAFRQHDVRDTVEHLSLRLESGQA